MDHPPQQQVQPQQQQYRQQQQCSFDITFGDEIPIPDPEKEFDRRVDELAHRLRETGAPNG